MNKIFKRTVDTIIIILFIVLMGYHITGNKIHEVLGVITFIFFIIHNLLNIRWYKSIFRVKYNLYRIFQTSINLLLLVSFCGMIISGVMISSFAFDFLNIPSTMFGRSLHMISTSWGFIFMSIHVGLHLHGILIKLNKKIKNSTFEYIYYLNIFLFSIFGLYTFMTSGLWKDMLLVTKFKFFDYDQNFCIFYLGQISIFVFFSFLGYLVLYFIKKLRKVIVKKV